MATVTHIEKVGRRKVDEYHVLDGTETLATTHCVGVPDDTWSLMIGGKFAGLAKGRSTAVAKLEAVAAQVGA